VVGVVSCTVFENRMLHSTFGFGRMLRLWDFRGPSRVFKHPSGVFYMSERIDVAFEATLDSLIIYYVGPPVIIKVF